MFPSSFPRDVRNNLLASDLAKVAFQSGQVALSWAGSSSCSLQAGGIKDNPDGSAQAVYMSIPALDAGFSGAASRFGVTFNGRVFGLRVRYPYDYEALDVNVDGEAFTILMKNAHFSNAGVGTGSYAAEAAFVVTDRLEDEVHYAEVSLTPSLPGGATRTATVLGLLLEKRCGYRDTVPTAIQYVNQVTLEVTQRAFVYALNAPLPRRINSILYVNYTASPRLVTIQISGVTKFEIPLAAAGSSGSSYQLAFPADGLSALSTWTHGCDAATAVHATVLGAYV